MELKLYITSKMAAIMLAGGLAIALVFGLALGLGSWGSRPQVQPDVRISRVEPVVPLIAFHGFGNVVELLEPSEAGLEVTTSESGGEQIIRLLPFGNVTEWSNG